MSNEAPLAVNIVDEIISARWIAPVEPENVLLENHSVVVDAGRIVAVAPTAEALQRYDGRRRIELGEQLLLPGLINLHTHAAMTLLRGYADDIALMNWLEDHIWPAEGRNMSARFVHDGSLLACWEMLRGGVTCFNDMYFFPDAAAAAAIEAGMRAALGVTVFEFPSAWGAGPAEYLAKGLAVRQQLAAEPLVSFCFAPHAPYTVSDDTFRRIAELNGDLALPVHMHLHETVAEIEGSLGQYGVRPVERLHRLGLINEHLLAVHSVHLDNDEIDLLAAHGCKVVHCPTSNMKLASGVAPLHSLLASGVLIGLGSDGAASNNRLDILREMRQAALLAKVASLDATALPAHRLLRMATLDAARALGLGERIGSLVPGKRADMTAVALDEWILAPCYDPISHLVHVAGRDQVTHVWVDGKLRIRDKTPVDLDIPALLDKVNMWQNAPIC